jgi:hypothetical protein
MRPSGPGWAGRSSVERSLPDRVKRTCGNAIAMRFTRSVMAALSARSVFMNLSRAGVAKNRSRTSTTVPWLPATGRTGCSVPPSTRISAPSAPVVRERIDKRDTEPIDGSASPRKPSERMSKMSSPSLEVQCRPIASGNSSGRIPQPSSVTRRSVSPPPAVAISMRDAPASSAFSTSSLTTLAGRSMTSPAAIWLMTLSESWRMGMACV